MNEVDKLIWPAPKGIGLMDPGLFAITNNIASTYGLIREPADPSVTYRNDLAQEAIDALKAKGLDVTGANYQPMTVQVTEGGHQERDPNAPATRHAPLSSAAILPG